MTRRLRRLTLVIVLALVAGRLSPALPSAGGLEAVVKDDKGRPVADAVVSVTSSTPAAGARRAAPAVMDQQNKEFVPHVLPVLAGTAVTFPNRDNIRHHVYSFSPAKRFELPLYIGTPAAPVVFDKPGVVVLGCNIHDWMVGYIYVLDTPYFGKTGDDGTVRLADVPPGSYEARVWHPRMRADSQTTARPVTITAAAPGRLDFAVALKPERRAPRRPGGYEGAQGG